MGNHACGLFVEDKPRPDTIHYMERVCKICGKFIKWVKNPNTIRTQLVKEGLGKMIQAIYGRLFCFFCNRTEAQLPPLETIETDHILALSRGGTDEIENTMLLCSMCHRQKNWIQTYVTNHIYGNKEVDGDADSCKRESAKPDTDSST